MLADNLSNEIQQLCYLLKLPSLLGIQVCNTKLYFNKWDMHFIKAKCWPLLGKKKNNIGIRYILYYCHYIEV